ncbi:phage holin, LLH family [Robertmurraya siralis]|uniref:phage holin, LLH family n=1 Tax=Robertmurraya siralis TaxID=77777 RepID=UPI0010F725B7|nr:phage holin, LLH family [Robertmurraya siralis]
MDVFLSSITQFAVELLVIVIGTLLTVALNKVRVYFNTLKQKDELGIVDAITDLMVEYTEKELKGKKGIEKRDFAVEKAIAILAEKGITVSKDEVIAGIENGVNKINKNKIEK